MAISSDKNRFGLSRYIPAKVRKEVRRRARFGCVICCDAITTYEHFNPPFRDAKEHSAKGITLLCGSHQNESSKGILSAETIEKADRSPCAAAKGHVAHVFDLGGRTPTLVLGSNNFKEAKGIISINDKVYLKVSAPEKHSSRWRLSATFHDTTGEVVCEIADNELRANYRGYDFESVGRRFIIRDKEEKILALIITPPDLLKVERMLIRDNFGSVRIDGDDVVIDTPRMSDIRLAHNLFSGGAGIKIYGDGSVGIGANQ